MSFNLMTPSKTVFKTILLKYFLPVVSRRGTSGVSGGRSGVSGISGVALSGISGVALSGISGVALSGISGVALSGISEVSVGISGVRVAASASSSNLTK